MEDSRPILKKVKCGTVSLQQLRRIALPTVLTENMEIGEGDELTVYYDPDSKAAVLIKSEVLQQPVAKYTKKARVR